MMQYSRTIDYNIGTHIYAFDVPLCIKEKTLTFFYHGEANASLMHVRIIEDVKRVILSAPVEHIRAMAILEYGHAHLPPILTSPRIPINQGRPMQSLQVKLYTDGRGGKGYLTLVYI